MTWIVGTVPPFGYSILVSDIRVSWQSGVERDCLQKVYKIGDDYLCGFAGSVRIGFTLLNVLSYQIPDKQKRGPRYIAEDWIPSVCRKFFDRSFEVERRLGCQLMLAAAHPTENLGESPWPRTFVWKFSYPDFNPIATGSREVLGIGNGSAVPFYVSAMTETCASFDFLKMITGGETMQAQLLAGHMYDLVEKAGIPGVSPFMQSSLVTRGRALHGDYNFKRWHADGKVQDIRLPAVARSYEEFKAYAKRIGMAAPNAVC